MHADIVIIHLAHDTKEDMYALNRTYRLKEENVGTPKIYIGANYEKIQEKNRKECWLTNCVDYLQGNIKNAEYILSKDHGACIK